MQQKSNNQIMQGMEGAYNHTSLIFLLEILSHYQIIPIITNPVTEMAFENNMGKGKNADNQHFPFSHNAFYTPSKEKFQSLTFNVSSAKFNVFNLDESKVLLFSIWFNLYHTIWTFTILGKKPFENNMGKGENDGNQHFLLFPQCF